MSGSELIECIKSMLADERRELVELLGIEQIKQANGVEIPPGLPGVLLQEYFKLSLTEDQAREEERSTSEQVARKNRVSGLIVLNSRRQVPVLSKVGE
jgi:hypothetical protein